MSVDGMMATQRIRIKLPMPTTLMDRSFSVLGTFSSFTPSTPLFFKEPILPLNEEIMVGMVLIREIKPPAATAPAPICLT